MTCTKNWKSSLLNKSSLQSTKSPISWNIPGQGWVRCGGTGPRAWIGLTNDRCHSDTLFTGLGWAAKNWQTYRRGDPAIDNIVSRAMNKPFRIIINRDNWHQADTIENQAPSVFANRYVWIMFGVNPILIVVLGMKICTKSWYIEQCLYLRRCRYLCYGYQDSYRSAAGQRQHHQKSRVSMMFLTIYVYSLEMYFQKMFMTICCEISGGWNSGGSVAV